MRYAAIADIATACKVDETLHSCEYGWLEAIDVLV